MAFISSEGAIFSGRDVAELQYNQLRQELDEGNITLQDYLDGIRQMMQTRGDDEYNIQKAIRNECIELGIEP